MNKFEINFNPSDVGKLNKILTVLGDSMRRKIVAEAIFKGAKIVEAAAKLKVPKSSGNLAKSITTKKINQSNAIGARVLARRSSAFPGGYYSHLIERGHRQVRTLSNGKVIDIGYYPPHPYMRPALIENREKVLETIAQETSNGVDKFKGAG